MTSFQYFNSEKIYSFYHQKMNYIPRTEKYFYVEIVERLMDLMVYKFLQCVVQDEEHPQNRFLPDLDSSISKLTSFLEKSAKELNNMILNEGKKSQNSKKKRRESLVKDKNLVDNHVYDDITIKNQIQSSRRDQFRIGIQKKSTSFYNVFGSEIGN